MWVKSTPFCTGLFADLIVVDCSAPLFPIDSACGCVEPKFKTLGIKRKMLVRIIRQQGYSWTRFKVLMKHATMSHDSTTIGSTASHTVQRRSLPASKAPWVMMHDQLVGLRTGLWGHTYRWEIWNAEGEEEESDVESRDGFCLLELLP